MKKTHIASILFLVIAFINCTNKRQYDNDTLIIEMDLNKTTSIHDIGLIDSINIVRLDNEIMFGRINKVIKSDNRFYLLDAFMTNSVIVYDTTGVLVKQIANIGRGPEEYLQPTDIFIDKNENVLGLISRMDKKLLKYNLADLNLIAVEKLPQTFFHVLNTHYGYVGYMNNLIENKPFNLWTMTKSLELEASFFDISSSWDSKASATIHPFSTYKDKTYYIQPYDFNIYCVNKNEKNILYKYDLGKNTWPSKIIAYEDVEKVRESSPYQYVEGFYMFQETKKHLITKMVFNGQELLGVYDKNTTKSYTATLDSYTNKYLVSFGQIVGMDENAMYTLVGAESVKRNIIGKDEYNDFESIYPEQIKNLREKFKDFTINEADNPFLLIHYFNK